MYILKNVVLDNLKLLIFKSNKKTKKIQIAPYEKKFTNLQNYFFRIPFESLYKETRIVNEIDKFKPPKQKSFKIR